MNAARAARWIVTTVMMYSQTGRSRRTVAGRGKRAGTLGVALRRQGRNGFPNLMRQWTGVAHERSIPSIKISIFSNRQSPVTKPETGQVTRRTGLSLAHEAPKFYRSSLPVSPQNASHFIHARAENATSHDARSSKRRSVQAKPAVLFMTPSSHGWLSKRADSLGSGMARIPAASFCSPENVAKRGKTTAIAADECHLPDCIETGRCRGAAFVSMMEQAPVAR